jgi:23S rRNA (cytosine1962-C5)-methyltransferase
VRFEISFSSGYSQGIFLDQRDNRKQLRDLVATGTTLLNTFAYTGAFSIVAAMAGATTTTLDLSQPYLDWARRNFRHNDLNPDGHFFCRGDTFHWLKRFAKQRRRFDAIILDPPTFSRSDKGKVFRAEKDYSALAELALGCLAADGTLLCCTNCRSLSLFDFEVQVREGAGSRVHINSAPMPPDFPDTPYLKSLWVTR